MPMIYIMQNYFVNTKLILPFKENDDVFMDIFAIFSSDTLYNIHPTIWNKCENWILNEDEE